MRDPRQDTPADEMGLRGHDGDAPPPARSLLPTLGLDVFWPILAVVLVTAVIFVATVAHNSMDGVGVPVSLNANRSPKPATSAGPILIVQVSSHTTRSAAQAAVEEFIGRGFDAKVLKSDDYRPLNRGYYVVYTGPYPATTAGRAEAKRIQSKLSGALLRDVHPR